MERNESNPLVDGAGSDNLQKLAAGLDVEAAAIASPTGEVSIAKPPIVYELDPGMKYVVQAGQTVLGEIIMLNPSNVLTVYFKVQASLPANTSSITITASAESAAPKTYTFKLAPAPSYSATSAPASSSTLFVNSSPLFGLIWDFTQSGNSWTGRATFYNKNSSTIHLTAGTYTLNNNTTNSLLTYVAVDGNI